MQRAPAQRTSAPGARGGPVQPRHPALVPVQRYYTEDCEDFDANQRRRGVAIAIELATRAVDVLSTYITAKSAGTPDPVTAKLLKDCFSSDSLWAAIRARSGFRKIKSYLEGDDFTIECEDDCDDSNAYVYAVWTDVHMCMNVIKNYSERRFGEILLHEVSHVADGTDDEEYFYPPRGAKTTLSLSDALDNADCYEAFAAQV
ncbi:MAG: M35 family metallo-endopeptidase [Actinomycetes bacterium]